MKKLLTTMSAVAAAMSLYAADPGRLSGTSFENIDADTALNITLPTGELTNQGGYWRTNGTDSLIVRQGTSVDPESSLRPDAFLTTANAKYLEVKTASLTNSISRKVNADGSSVNINGGTAETKDLYFDSYVRFTAFEGDQTVDIGQGGKLAIWLRENLNESGDPQSTNLVITAGYLTSSGAVQTNYTCSVDTHADLYNGGWHRVTVKAIESIYKTGTKPGFVVFIDGYKATCDDVTTMGVGNDDLLTDNARVYYRKKVLFPSIVQDGEDVDTITAVDFAGTGDVDELVFTRTAPEFAQDNKFFKIIVDEHIATASYSRSGAAAVAMAPGSTNMVEWTVGTTFTLSNVTAAQGYITNGVELAETILETSPGVYTVNAAGSIATIKAKPLGAYVDNVPYATLTEAIDAANMSSSDCKVTLAANASAGITVNNSSGGTITIDLAGNTITNATGNDAAIYVRAGHVVVTNSTVEVGKVQASVTSGVLGNAAMKFRSATLTIQAGVYEGQVIATSISGGSFLATYNNKDVNTKESLDGFIVEGYEATLDGDYYVLTEAAPTFTVKYVYGLNQQSTNETANLKSGVSTPAAPAEAEINGYTLTWEPATNATVTANATYVANYTANSYTITYYDGENVLDLAPASYTYGAGVTLPASAGAKTGYTFDGWYDNAGLAGDPVTAVAANETGNQTFYAKYTADTYTITFVTEIGVAPASTNYTIESGTITLPTVTTSDVGVQFDGWTNGTYTTATNLFTPSAANLADFTLYAAWSSTGSGSFDGGDGNTFTIDPGAVSTVEAKTGHPMTDTVAGTDITYAQAYALGLVNESTGAVADLDATIEIKNGKVVVGLSSTPIDDYTITLKVYEKASLTAAWPVEPTHTYTLGSADATAGFTPGTASAGFYKTEVTISNK